MLLLPFMLPCCCIEFYCYWYCYCHCYCYCKVIVVVSVSLVTVINLYAFALLLLTKFTTNSYNSRSLVQSANLNLPLAIRSWNHGKTELDNCILVHSLFLEFVYFVRYDVLQHQTNNTTTSTTTNNKLTVLQSKT